MATVKVIPPREKVADILRVAAYCRVSSDSADQKHSYATQIRAYTEIISGHDGSVTIWLKHQNICQNRRC